MLRLKRWLKDPSREGIFMKDVVYTNGYLAVSNYMNSGWDLKKLYRGKIALGDLQEIDESGMMDIPEADIRTPFFS
jgi:hypothetical protein